MKKPGNHNAGIFTQYCGIMIFLLAISYILIVTNPPSDLLQYDENLGTITKQLSGPDILEHAGSISIFLALFALLSGFIGILMGYGVEKGVKELSERSILYGSIFSIFILGYLLSPYYGVSLAVIAWVIGYLSYVTGIWLGRGGPRYLRFRYVAVIWALMVGIIIHQLEILPAVISRSMTLVLLIILLLALRYRRRGK